MKTENTSAGRTADSVAAVFPTDYVHIAATQDGRNVKTKSWRNKMRQLTKIIALPGRIRRAIIAKIDYDTAGYMLSGASDRDTVVTSSKDALRKALKDL